MRSKHDVWLISLEVTIPMTVVSTNLAFPNNMLSGCSFIYAKYGNISIRFRILTVLKRNTSIVKFLVTDSVNGALGNVAVNCMMAIA